MNIVGKRYLYFAISLAVIVPGIIGLIIWGLPLAVDFSGGSLVELKFESGPPPSLEQVRQVYTQNDIPDAEPRSSGADGIIVRTPHLDDAANNKIIAALQAEIGHPITIVSFESVGPTVGKEVTTRAAGAVGIASLAIMIYIWYAFRGVPNAYRYGISAIIAMLHDVAVVFGIQAILSHFFGWEVDALFLTALLTVIGFSVHDSIVVFDRIRENASKHRRQDFESIVEMSVEQTLVRSINTQLTVFLTLLALVIFGGSTIRHFVVILMIGVLSGTYSSIFNAAPILVVWENREWQHWFRKSPKPTA